MELLKQPQYTPYAVEDQVASIWTGTNGYLDDVDVKDVGRFEAELLDHLRRNSDVLTTIRETGKLEDATEEALRAAVEEFRRGFLDAEGNPLGAEPALDADEVEAEHAQEQIVSAKRG